LLFLFYPELRVSDVREAIIIPVFVPTEKHAGTKKSAGGSSGKNQDGPSVFEAVTSFQRLWYSVLSNQSGSGKSKRIPRSGI